MVNLSEAIGITEHSCSARVRTGVANTGKISSIKEAKQILNVSGLWEHFQLDGSPGKSCRSPFRNDRNPSFSVYIDKNGEERFKDHGCGGCEGDSYDFFQQCSNLDANAAFLPFLKLAEELKDDPTSGIFRPVTRRDTTEIPDLPPDFREQTWAMRKRLLTDRDLMDRFAKSRGWHSETVWALADQGSLGWHEDGPAFIYQTGIKVRPGWFNGGERIVRWICGSTGIWRQEMISKKQKVYITEGETDCISLVDCRIERDERTVIVATPSATTFKPGWGQTFKGKCVTLCYDNDEAGRAGIEKAAEILLPFASEITTFNWEGIRNER